VREEKRALRVTKVIEDLRVPREKREPQVRLVVIDI
jgi:hypothetical protein